MTVVVAGETILIDESTTETEAMRIYFAVAEERGHSAPSVVVDEQGSAITDPRYVDRMGAVHIKAGAWAFCRRPAAEALGLPCGTDWVRDHNPHLMFFEGSPYLPKPHLYNQLYVQPVGDPHPQPHQPLCEAGTVAWRNSGTHVCVLEERLGQHFRNTALSQYLLWEYDPALGTRRLITGFPTAAELGFVEVSYSPDDTWILLCDWRCGRNLLVRVFDGAVIALPITSPAAGWNPRAGATAMVVMIPEPESAIVSIYDYDLATNRAAKRSDLASPHGLPLTVRGLSMSTDGRSALVTAPLSTSGLDQRRRGGVQLATVIDINDGTIEPVLPVAFHTRGAQRRHTSPRWCEDPIPVQPARTTLADELLATATTHPVEPNTVAANRDRLERWLETAEGIEQSWNSGRMPASRFGEEFLQNLLSVGEIDTQAADTVLARLTHTSPIVAALRSARHGGMRPLGRCREETTTPADTGHRYSGTDADLVAVRPILATMADARLIPAIGDAVTRLLAWAAARDLTGRQVWLALATLAETAARHEDHDFAITCGRATSRWNTDLVGRHPELARLGLRAAPRSVELEILLTCFHATIRHQPPTSASTTSVDTDTVRISVQRRLNELSVDTYLRTAAALPDLQRTYTFTGPPDPTARNTDVEESRLSRRRIFMSYVREDLDAVTRLAEALTRSGFDVWLDLTHLLPGMRWQSEIKKAIRAGDYFIACFSPRYCAKLMSYMNEELIVATEQLRLMPRTRRWFIPIMLETCEIPDLPIGPGETLDKAIQYVDFSKDWDKAVQDVVRSLDHGPIEPATHPPSATERANTPRLH